MKLRITINGKAYEADVEILEEDEAAPEYPPYPPAPSVLIPAEIAAPIMAPQPAENEGSDKECRSPVTGMVINVGVAPGQAVETNDVVMVLESMKMEMQITASRAARVKSVLVTPGTAVKANQLLVEFE